MSERGFDAIVVGGDAAGMIAGAYLARRGLRTIVLDARERDPDPDPGTSGGAAASVVHALDAKVISELQLALRYIARDVPLVALRSDGHHLVFDRDVYRTARAIESVSVADARSWANFRRETFALARAMRALWWPESVDRDLAAAMSHRDALEVVRFSGAASWLGRWFESDAVRSALAFDATEGGAAVNAPPSALVLLWSMAQEMCGLQAARALVEGGAAALAAAAADAALKAGAEVRYGACVEEILIRDGRAIGVELRSGGRIAAPAVLSSLSCEATQSLAPPGSFGIAQMRPDAGHAGAVGEAHIVLALDRPPRLGADTPQGARLIFCERVESLVDAHAAAQSGRVPDELSFEAIAVAAPGTEAPTTLSLRVRPVPAAPEGGWESARELLAARALVALSAYDRSLRDAMTAIRIERAGGAHGGREGPVTPARLLATPRARIATPIEGLFLCGRDAEPVGAVSGRAARLAAGLVASRKVAMEASSR